MYKAKKYIGQQYFINKNILSFNKLIVTEISVVIFILSIKFGHS